MRSIQILLYNVKNNHSNSFGAVVHYNPPTKNSGILGSAQHDIVSTHIISFLAMVPLG